MNSQRTRVKNRSRVLFSVGPETDYVKALNYKIIGQELRSRERVQPSSTRKMLSTKVTWLYYHRKLTQKQIAEELGISRPTVIRLLRQASEQGLVTVTLRLDILRRMDVAQELAQRFGLKEVLIVPTSKRDSKSDVIRAVGRTGALYPETNIKPDQILTISWGRMIYEVATALTEKPVSGLVVAQSFGGLNSGESFNPSRVTSLIGEKLHARVYHLYVPAMVATKELRDVLLADPGIHAALEVARHASIFMAGIGKVENTATILETGFLTSPPSIAYGLAAR